MKTNGMKQFFMSTVMSLLVFAGVAMGAAWTGDGDAINWSDGNNWSSMATPSKTTEVEIDGTAKVNYDVSGEFERSANTTLAGHAELNLINKRFLHGNSAESTFTMSDNAKVNQRGDYFIIGQNHLSTINQLGGTFHAVVHRGFFMTDREGGEGSSYQLLGGTLIVEYDSQGSDFYNELLGRYANGYFLVDGGTANFSVINGQDNRRIYIKRDSEFQIDSGAANFDGFRWFIIGRQDADMEAKVIINGGTMTVTTLPAGAMVIGSEGGMGKMLVNGGELILNSTNGLWVGEHMRGIVEQTNGLIDIAGPVVLGREAGSVYSYYHMDGGILKASDIQITANTDATVEFIFDSGIIMLTGDKSSLIDEAWFVEAEGTQIRYDAEADVTTISRLPYAHDPMPVSETINYGRVLSNGKVEVTLGWTSGLDIANPTVANPNITHHLLYMAKESDPNMILVDEIGTGSPVALDVSYGPLELELDERYLWRVDEQLNSSEVIEGRVWVFETPRSVPTIDVEPVDVFVHPGETARFEVEASSVTQEWYQWYVSDDQIATPDTDTAIGGDSSVLILEGVNSSKQGYYYCVVSNGGGDTNSDVVTLGVYNKVAHWSFDSEDYVDGVFVDLSGMGHAADPNAEPTLVDSEIGQAIEISRPVGTNPPATNAWPIAGNWNPSEITNQLSVSLWLKWDGTNGTWQTFVCKRSGSGFNTGNAMWQISSAENDNDLWFQSPYSTISVTDGLVVGEWQHVVVTFDGETAKIYINGAEKASGGFQLGDNYLATICLGGNSYESSAENWMNGQLDDVQMYNYALDQYEVADLYFAVSHEALCLNPNEVDLRFDTNNDCRIDIVDFATFASEWMACGLYPQTVCY